MNSEQFNKDKAMFEKQYQEMFQNLVELTKTELMDENRKTRIYEECSALTEALNELIKALIENV